MERTEGTSRPPLSAEQDADCSQKADDTSETEEEELNEEGDESLHKNQGGQTSVSEKQMTADEKCSEEVVQVISLPPKSALSPNLHGRKCLPSPSPLHQKGHRAVFQGSSTQEKSKEQAIQNILPYSYMFFSRFSPPTSNWNTVQSPYIPSHERLPSYPPYLPFNDTSPTSSPESIVNTHSANRYGETLTPAEGLSDMLFQSAKRIPNMTADTDSDWRKKTVTRASSSLDSPDEFIHRYRKKRFPFTAADATPGQSQDNTRGTALYATAGPSTVPLSTKDDKDSDPAAFYDREKGVELPGSMFYPDTSMPKSGGASYFPSYDNPLTSSQSIIHSHSAQQYGGTCTPAESCSEMPVKSAKSHFISSHLLPLSRGRVTEKSAKRISNETADTDSDCDTKHKMQKPQITYGRKKKSIVDITNELIRRKRREMHSVTAANARPGQSQDNTWETASPGKPLHETSGGGYFLPGSSSTQIHADPQKPGGSAREEMFLPVTAGNYSTENPLSFDPRLQQPSPPYFAAMVKHFPSYSTSSLSQLPSAKNRTLTQAENVSDMPLDYSAKRIPKITADTDSDWRKKTVTRASSSLDYPDFIIRIDRRKRFPSTAADATPGQRQDNTWETASPGKPLHETSGRGYFLPGSSSTQIHADPQKPGGSAREEMFPPVTAGNYSTENPLSVDPRLQQPSSPYFAEMVKHFPSYSTSSLSQIPSAKKRALTQAENVSDMPLDYSAKRIPKITADTDSSDSDCDTSERSKMRSAVKHERKSKIQSPRRKKKSKKSSPGVASTADSSDYTFDRPPPGPLRETVIKTPFTAADATPGHSQDNTRETELHARAGPSTLQHFMVNLSDSPDSDTLLDDRWSCRSVQSENASGAESDAQLEMETSRTGVTWPTESDGLFTLEHIAALDDCLSDSDTLDDRWSCSPDGYSAESGENRSVQSETASGAESDAQLEMETSRTDVNCSVTNTWPTESTGPFTLQQPDFRVQSPAELSDFYPELELLDDLFSGYSSAVHTAGSGEDIIVQVLSVPSECETGGVGLLILEAPVTAVKSSVTNTQPTRPHLQLSSDPGQSQRGSSCLPRSHSVPSLSQISSAENKTFRPSESLPDLLFKSSFEEFTPDVTVDENDETYRFLCSCPGLYQCSVTGLVFHMEGEGHVVYRVVSWDRRLLAQHHKKPAGPLFDIKCLQQSVCRLHLPHCEIRSTAGCGFLSVAHVKDESIEFIPPHKITETHVIINITGFSGFGNVKDEDSPPEPVQALVLLFYRPPDDQGLESLLNVLMLPGNVVLRDVQRTRKSLVGDELYIETSPHCKLLPKQEYTLSTCPEDDSVLVQPTTAEFYCDNYDNYFTSFQVDLEKILKHIKLFLRDTNRHSVWERRLCLSSAGLKKSCGQSALNLPPNKKLFDVWSSFIEGISGPVLKSLLDKLFEKTVLTDPERESADEMQNKRDKARFVIDTVRRKGEAASSEMIEILCELDPFLCEHLGLI